MYSGIHFINNVWLFVSNILKFGLCEIKMYLIIYIFCNQFIKYDHFSESLIHNILFWLLCFILLSLNVILINDIIKKELF